MEFGLLKTDQKVKGLTKTLQDFGRVCIYNLCWRFEISHIKDTELLSKEIKYGIKQTYKKVTIFKNSLVYLKIL